MTVTLSVNGKDYAGWKTMDVTLSMENLAGGFSLGVSEKWPNGQRDIKPGDACAVKMNGQTVITGYVDDTDVSFDATTHELTVTGRDKAGDLVDCSAINKPGQWSGVKMDRIAQELCKPFGIPVKTETSVGEAFKKFNLEQGETVFEAIKRMADLRGVLVLSDGRGGLTITNRGTEKASTALICLPGNNSNNILAGRINHSYKDRFSKILVKGQTQGSDKQSGDVTRGAKGKALDPQITRYRPLLVTAEGQANAKQCQERANWEIQTRKGKAKRLNIGVQGWTQKNGAIWEINTLVKVSAPFLKVDQEMLIVECHFRLNDGGTITELTLTEPGAFDAIRKLESKS